MPREALKMTSNRTTGVGALIDGTVAGAPRRWLRLEGAALLVGCLVSYSTTHQSWWLIPLAILLPDVVMAGYLGGTRLGAIVYNLGHSTPLPALVIGFGWWRQEALVLALGLVWLAHIGLDGFCPTA
jgi:hypothetical protein